MRIEKFRTRVIYVALSLLLVCASAAAQTPRNIKDLQPTVVLISIDGLRADYLEKFQPKTLNELARKGVRAKWLIPAYPSLTFPNHYTIATGLRPENHGIVGNNIYDPEFDDTFSLSKKEAVQNGRWWGGEPVWVTAEKQKMRAAAFFFPGTEAKIAGFRPTFWREFDDEFPNEKRVAQILEWLDLPKGDRPQMLTLYFSDVDHAGHDFSPDAPETGKAVLEIDRVLGELVAGLKTRKIFDKINLVIVSDHGMTTVPPDQYVILSDYFDETKAVRVVWGSEITHIFPKDGEEKTIFESLNAQPISHTRCFRKSEFPSEFNFRNHRRIGAILCQADEGWRIMSRARYDKDKQENKLPTANRGAHGYDHQLESMRATFIAHGAAFKKKKVVESFENVDVYNIMTRILDLTPAPNDGDAATANKVLK